MGIIDKIIFGILLIGSLQVPMLADHYHQYLSGFFEATKQQVEGYQRTAHQHQYHNIEAMIDAHLQSRLPSVRTDARQKLQTLEQYDELKAGISTFNNGLLIEKLVYMLNPSRYHTLSIKRL